MVPNIAIRSANRWLCEIIFISYADLSWENQIFVISTKPHKYKGTSNCVMNYAKEPDYCKSR